MANIPQSDFLTTKNLSQVFNHLSPTMADAQEFQKQ